MSKPLYSKGVSAKVYQFLAQQTKGWGYSITLNKGMMCSLMKWTELHCSGIYWCILIFAVRYYQQSLNIAAHFTRTDFYLARKAYLSGKDSWVQAFDWWTRWTNTFCQPKFRHQNVFDACRFSFDLNDYRYSQSFIFPFIYTPCLVNLLF